MQVQKGMFPSCLRNVWRHIFNTVYHSMRKSVRRVFCECWLLYLFLQWLGESVLSVGFPAWSQKHPFYFRKLNMVNKAVVMKRKMKKYVFLASLRLQLCSLYWGKYFFCHKFPVPRFTKSCFPVISEAVEDRCSHRLGKPMLLILNTQYEDCKLYEAITFYFWPAEQIWKILHGWSLGNCHSSRKAMSTPVLVTWIPN